ncbi:MAG: hypothetical protein HFE97_03315 [Oscillospiraceae bacterium]|nr:hypothetical protein [Oscillospiraceae bacterium]
MNARQERFCLEYAASGTPTQRRQTASKASKLFARSRVLPQVGGPSGLPGQSAGAGA